MTCPPCNQDCNQGRECPARYPAATPKGYVAAPGGVFLDPEEHRPPRGAKILLLTPAGVCIIGHWDPWCVAWCPLPVVPPPLKEKL